MATDLALAAGIGEPEIGRGVQLGEKRRDVDVLSDAGKARRDIGGCSNRGGVLVACSPECVSRGTHAGIPFPFRGASGEPVTMSGKVVHVRKPAALRELDSSRRRGARM